MRRLRRFTRALPAALAAAWRQQAPRTPDDPGGPAAPRRPHGARSARSLDSSAQPARRQAAGRPSRRVVRITGMAVVALLIAAPGLVLVRETLPYQVPVFPAPIVGVPASAAAQLAFPRFEMAVPVLLYRDVSTRPGRQTVTPTRLAEQLAGLRAAGFRSVTLAQLRALLNGVAVRLPQRPVLLLFAGGLATHWTTVTPILRVYGFQGVSFVPTGSIAERSPSYYLTTDEIRSMARSGRWEFGTESHEGTGTIPTVRGRTGSWLTSRMRRPDRSVESLPEWRRRVVGDLDRSKEALGGLVRQPVDAFAYPSLAARLPATDRALAAELGVVLGERFALAFRTGDGPDEVAMPAGGRFHVPTIGVRGADTAASILRRLRRAVPASLPGEPSTLHWHADGGSIRRSGRAALTLTAHGYARARVDLNTAHWGDYRLDTDVRGVSRDATAVVAVRASNHGAVELLIGERRVLVRQLIRRRRTVLGEFPFASSGPRRHAGRDEPPSREVHLRVVGDVLVLWLDERPMPPLLLDQRLRSGGIEFGLAARGRQAVTFGRLRVSPATRVETASFRR